jgi:hypothetical protein
MTTIVERLLSGIVSLAVLIVVTAQLNVHNNPARSLLQFVLDIFSGTR